MKWSYSPYGHAYCPHCHTEFNLKEALPTFGEKTPHNDTLVYVMCPDCHAAFQSAGSQGRKGMSNTCFVNVKLDGVAKDGGRIPFAVTSALTLALNDGCITSAIENGHDLTESEYFLICSGQYQVTALPGGLHIISPRDTTP